MLEMFFDNGKVFTVFERILKSKSEEVNMARLLYELKIPVDDAADILSSFVFLGILEETEKTREEGIFKFNPMSRVVLGLCLFDEIVGEYFFEKAKKELVDNGEKDGLFSILKEKDFEVEINKDFINFLKENGFEL